MNALNSSRPNSEAGAATAAPVLDYACLFSHDLKRKQKRWQDGRLKFHCFNKRVMVYDERGNFIGDMHWTMDYDFDEGEEFQLERGCVIVQVSECLGRKEQDLSELIDRRYKDREERQSHAAAAAATRPYRPAPTPHRPPMPVARPTAAIATPGGNQLGRAVLPTISPFEQRNLNAQGAHQRDDHARPTKRRKPDISPPSKSGYARALFGAPLALSAFTSSASQQSNVAPSQPSEDRPVDTERLVPRSRPMPSLLRVQPSLLVDTPSKPPKSARRSDPIDVPDSSPALDSVHDDTTSAEPRVNPRASGRQTAMKPVRPTLTSSHQRRSPAQEEASSGPANIASESHVLPPRPVARARKDLQARAANRAPLLSAARQHNVQPTPDQRCADSTTKARPSSFAADVLEGGERTSLVSSTKRTRKRGLLIASEKSTTSKRHKNSADESDRTSAKPTRSSRASPEGTGTKKERRRKVSAGLMFDDDDNDDVIDISDDTASVSSKSLSTKLTEPAPKARTSKLASHAVRRASSLSHMSAEDSQDNDAQSNDEDVGIRQRARSRRAKPQPVESESDTPVTAGSSDRSSSPEARVEVPRSRRVHEHDNPQQLQSNRPHLATLRRSIKSKEIIGFYGSANSSREAAALARMRESMSSRRGEEEPAATEHSRLAEAKEEEAEKMRARQEHARAREAQEEEAREEEARQRRIREEQAREEARQKQLEKEAREEAARQEQLRERAAREEEKRQQEVREREIREQKAREEELRLQQIREKEAREQKAREEELRLQQIREKEAREQKAREEEKRQQEIREREARELKAREEELRQQRVREREAREKEAREREAREREAREREAREREEREKEDRAREAREREAREAEERERKAREREARLEAREREAQEREARLEAREQENRLREAREKDAREKEVQADKTRQKDIREKARLPRFVPPTRPSKLGVDVRTSLSRGAPPSGPGDEEPTTAGASTNVVNPATRNRKAAQKSDAAGQLSRTVIPVTDTGVTVDRRVEVSGQGLTTASVNMPGFTRANGGPWSIQAHDLLGIGRPS